MVLLVGALGGCNGLLNVSPGNGQRPCTTSSECDTGDLCIGGICSFGNNGACWVYNEQGSCPAGKQCVDGVCTGRALGGWCDCEPTRGCLNGQCVELSEDTLCSDVRPNGACIDGSVCVAGTCVEITPGNICSSNRLNGLCPSGAACLRGQCVPIAEDPCGPTNTDGLCSSGSRCNSQGECELVPCSSVAPNGACTVAGTYCDDGSCVVIPCSRQNPNGPCEDSANFFCSSEGICIPRGTCAGDGDCDTGNYCGAAGVCRPNGTCVEPADCGAFSTCNNNTCVRDLTCVDDTDCPSGEHCLNYPGGGQCGPVFACIDASDCPEGYCSAIGECASTDQCFNNADCVGDRCDYPSCRCSAVNTCIDTDGCAVNADCGLGERCGSGTCLPIATCGQAACGGGTCCTDVDQRCSTDPGTDLCLPVGRCRTDADCGHGVDCNVTDGTCSVGTACTRATEATACPGGFCNSYGVCATGSRAANDCTTPFDCDAGEVCDATFKCALGDNCGGEEFSTTEIAPNMLILLDRSGSMNWNTTDNNNHDLGTNECPAQNVKRWPVAVGAIQAVLDEYNDGEIRFGLSTYPSENLCGGPSPCPARCTNECINVCNVPTAQVPSGSCNDDRFSQCGNCEPGYVDEPMGASTAAIMADLNANGPGGRTPTARALRVIADSPATYGLPPTNDPVERDNYVLLITDGDPNCPTAGASCAQACRVGQNGCDANCMVNIELNRLRGLPKPIKTFTVGFAFSSIRPNLNCNAVNGGTSLCGGGVTAANCSGYDDTACYYNASSPAALVTALSTISRQISGCTFDMDQAPPDIERLYVFTRQLVGGAPTGAYLPVSNNTSDPDGYYTLVGLRIQLFGEVCDRVRDGLEKPVVIYGCPQPGG